MHQNRAILCVCGGDFAGSLRLPFQQRRFSGDFFDFFDFSQLPSKLAMNLVMPSLSLMCILLPAFWPSSAQSLVLSASEA